MNASYDKVHCKAFTVQHSLETFSRKTFEMSSKEGICTIQCGTCRQMSPRLTTLCNPKPAECFKGLNCLRFFDEINFPDSCMISESELLTLRSGCFWSLLRNLKNRIFFSAWTMENVHFNYFLFFEFQNLLRLSLKLLANSIL